MPPAGPRPEPRRPRLAWALVALAALLPYAGTLGHGFAFDDVSEVVRNHDVRALANLPRLFAGGAWEGAGEANPIYRPLTSATYALNHALGGLAPFGYHLVNLLLHAAASLLLLALALRLGLALPAAALAAALFAVHPVHVEVVANVAGRKDALAAVFALAAVLAHDTALRRGGARLVLPVLALAAALFSKESGAAALGLVLAWDLLVAQGAWREWRARALGLYAAYAATLGLYLAARRAAVGSLGVPLAFIPFGENPLAHGPAGERLLTAVAVLGRGLLLQVAPLSLSPDYSWDAIPVVRSALSPAFLASAAAHAALGAGALLAARRRPPLAFAAALYAAALAPAANLLFPIGTIFGERLLYLPSAGLCLALGAALSGWASDALSSRAAFALAALLLGGLGARAAAYAAVWSDEVALFAHAVREVPRSAKAHQLLGEALLEAGQVEEGGRELEAAVALLRGAPEVPPGLRVELGVAWEQAGRLEEAEAAYLRLLAERPEQPDALWRLGVVRWRGGRRAEAEALWQRAARAAPQDARILTDLGLAASARGDAAAAEALWLRATTADPRVAGPWLALGNLFERRGEPARAREAWTRFLDAAKYGAWPREREAVAEKLRASAPPESR